jgi:exonuclease VII large subunit
MVESDKACENCKEKFENDELPKCDCGRLKTRYTCDCKEEENEKELPLLPHQNGGMALFYETQINGLREEKNQLTEEVETHLEALEVAKDWHKRQKQELLDRIKHLEEKNKQLKELTPQELLNQGCAISPYEKNLCTYVHTTDFVPLSSYSFVVVVHLYEEILHVYVRACTNVRCIKNDGFLQ